VHAVSMCMCMMCLCVCICVVMCVNVGVCVCCVCMCMYVVCPCVYVYVCCGCIFVILELHQYINKLYFVCTGTMHKTLLHMFAYASADPLQVHILSPSTSTRDA